MLRKGDTIEYLADVSSPPDQEGIRGQTKIIDRDISEWTARFLLRGGKVRLFDPASPLQLEEEETKEGPDGPAEIPGPVKKVSTKKTERRTTNGHRGKGKIHSEGRNGVSETDQAGDAESEKSDSKGRMRSRGD